MTVDRAIQLIIVLMLAVLSVVCTQLLVETRNTERIYIQPTTVENKGATPPNLTA